jgi:hypothetical protein
MPKPNSGACKAKITKINNASPNPRGEQDFIWSLSVLPGRLTKISKSRKNIALGQ